MKLIYFPYLNDTEVVLISPVFSIIGVEFVTESTSVFLKFESISHDLVLLLISFLADNTCSYLYVVPKRHIENSG